jgi:outer membrane protein assembly factor BamA
MLLEKTTVSILLLLLFTVATAQESRVITAISFEGLQRSRPDYLLIFLDDLIGNEPPTVSY